MLSKDAVESLFLLLCLLLLFNFVFHLHELFNLHTFFDFLLPEALLFSQPLLLEPLTLLRRKLILLKSGVGKVILLLTVSNPLPFFYIALVRFEVTFTPLSLRNFIILHVPLDQSLPVLLPLICAFNFPLGSPISSLLSLQPVLQLLAETAFLVSLHLIVASLALDLPFVVFVLVHTRVINEHIFTVKKRGAHPAAFVAEEVPALVPKGDHWPVFWTGKHLTVLLQLVR